MSPYLLRRVILPAWQHLRRQNSLQLLPSLERTQWLPANQLLDLQWRRIGASLKHAYDHVPYYRGIMRASGIDPTAMIKQRSLEKLPLLDRSTITEQLTSLRAINIPEDRFVPNGTGGSTGEPLRFFDDRQEVGWSEAAVFRSHRWFGVDVGDPSACLWGANFDLTTFQGFSGRLKSRVLNQLMLPAWELSETTASDFWQQLSDFRPRLLTAYAGAIYQWAQLLGRERPRIPSLVAIIVSAETLYEGWRESIEQCFKVPVYNRYGGRDINFVAQECQLQNGLHISCENVLVEVVKDGKEVSPGELGEIVITRLDNFAMPLIRYRSGDLGVMAGFSCNCGRSLPLLQKVEGRVQDAILTKSGSIISGPFFAHMMKDCPDIKEFQVHQLALDHLVIYSVLNTRQPFSSRERIERLVRHHLGSAMQIDFQVCDDIPLTRSGKRRIIISHLSTDKYSDSEPGRIQA